MIEVEQLTKKYAGKAAIEDLSFSVAKGEIVGFLGPNGAGKSTTMRILSSYLPPTAGRVSVAGYDVFQKSLQARRHIGYMPEDVPLYGDMRVREFLKFRGQLKGLGGRKLKERMGSVMELCSLREVEKKLIGTLSKGYRQRVGLADALIHEPDLLILDEPTIGLDPNQIRSVRDLIRDLGQKHTILLSSHILSEVEIVCSRVLIIHKGRIQASDTPENLLKTIRRAGSIRLEVKTRDNEDPAEALRAMKGVRDVAPAAEPREGWHTLRMRIEAESDLREAIYALAVDRRWKLRELSRINATLEDVFVEITQTDEH